MSKINTHIWNKQNKKKATLCAIYRIDVMHIMNLDCLDIRHTHALQYDISSTSLFSSSSFSVKCTSFIATLRFFVHKKLQRFQFGPSGQIKKSEHEKANKNYVEQTHMSMLNVHLSRLEYEIDSAIVIIILFFPMHSSLVRYLSHVHCTILQCV